MKSCIQLLRPHHYLKNLFLFLPLFFAGRILETSLLSRTLIGFIAFSMVASAVYILNDFKDRELDRRHPQKKFRPLASGVVSTSRAFSIMAVLLVLSIPVLAILDLNAMILTLCYLGINLLYSLKLKQLPLVDIFLVSSGFVIRIFVGSEICSVEPSMWLILMTFLLAMFLALAKRRDDVLLCLEGNSMTRKAIDGYNLEFLGASMVIMSATMIVSYIMYTIAPEVRQRVVNYPIYPTVAFVIMGILRYMQITFVEQKSGSPVQVLMTDRFLQLVISGWLLTFVWLLY
jgi:decaprenyl-phosphate phosphoribosyltransferase